MKTICAVTDGIEILIDDQDFDRVNAHRWYVNRKRKYVLTSINEKTVFLHRFILGLTPGDGIEIDHRNRMPSDCQRSNMRICTRAENLANRRIWTGRFRGAYPNGNGWQAQIKINGKLKYLGYFKTEEEAAKRYNEEAIKVHGEFAYLNEFEETVGV